MALWSIRRLMLAIAGVAVLLGGYVGLARVYEADLGHLIVTEHRMREFNLRNVVLGPPRLCESQRTVPCRDVARCEPVARRAIELVCRDLTRCRRSGPQDSIDMGKPWDSPANAAIACTRIGVLTCPDGPGSAGWTETHSVHRHRRPWDGCTLLVQGPSTGRRLRLRSPDHPGGYHRRHGLHDGLRRVRHVMGSWLSGGPATVRGLDTGEQPYIGSGRQFGGLTPSRGPCRLRRWLGPLHQRYDRSQGLRGPIDDRRRRTSSR